MTETLKPCPLCHSIDVYMTRNPSGLPHSVICRKCGCDAPWISWNTRAPDDVAQIVDWQPIESWPGTDEAYALVCRAGNVVPFVACYDENGDEWTSWNGHFERGGKQLIPTHWQPLPLPPSSAAIGRIRMMVDDIAGIEHATGLLIVQPALEPWPSAVRKVGSWAVFYYVRWSSFGVGIELLSAGAAIILGPFMFGACHIKRQLDAGDAIMRNHLKEEKDDDATG